jgi:hypothetical protein
MVEFSHGQGDGWRTASRRPGIRHRPTLLQAKGALINIHMAAIIAAWAHCSGCF